jgi:hypothetical protein
MIQFICHLPQNLFIMQRWKENEYILGLFARNDHILFGGVEN